MTVSTSRSRRTLPMTRRGCAYHATLYPAILNADLVDAGVTGGVHVTEYRRAVGTKG